MPTALKKKKKQQPTMFVLTVSPGKLGLTLSLVPGGGGAKIIKIDPECTFGGQVEVGDRVVTIDGNRVEKLEDLTVGKEKMRKFGIARAVKKEACENIGNKKAAAEVIGSKSAIFEEAAAAAKKYNPQNKDQSRKQTFPYLNLLNANGTDRAAEQIREDIMTELLQWDKRNNIETTAKMASCQYQLFAVPLHRRESAKARGMDKDVLAKHSFKIFNNSTKFFDKFLGAWASYCDGTKDDAMNMILYYVAKLYPQCYVKNFEMAMKKNDKLEGKKGPPPVELPPDFVSYDGTNDIKWNKRYGELLKYKEEHGDCKVSITHSDGGLAKWVSIQRNYRRDTANGTLSPKRIELLESIDFLWSGRPEGWARVVKGGDPRQNRAMAAKLVYPDLTIRECCYLGGFQDDELNAVKDQKHTWRTGLVHQKESIVKRIEKYENARRNAARLNVEELVNTLRGEEENRFDQVFGENASLLPGFLEAMEERRRNGIVEKPIKSKPRKKRVREEEDDIVDNNIRDEEKPGRKRAHVERGGHRTPV